VGIGVCRSSCPDATARRGALIGCPRLGNACALRLELDYSQRLVGTQENSPHRLPLSPPKRGTMRLVTRADEARFLAPLPVTLLPLPEAALRQLYWLGVRTLGQFAALPVAGVWQRFGQAGKLAQRLAQGQDNRPVLMTVRSAPEMVAVDVDPPGGEVKRMVAALMAAMCPVLKRLEQELAGCRRLRLRLQFVGGAERMIDIVFVEPTSQEARLRAAITERLSALIWPNNMERIECFFWEIGEQPAGQLTLFPATESDASPIDLAHKLARRYGVRFFQGALVNASHPVAGRRARLLAIG
jgi:hypothetical protein